MAEYAQLLGLVAIVVIAILLVVGEDIYALWLRIDDVILPALGG